MRCKVSLCITSYLCQHFIRFPQHSAGFQLFNPSWKNNTDRKVSLQEHKMKTMARLEHEHLSFSSPRHFRLLHPHIRKATFLIYTGSCKRKKIAIIYPSPPSLCKSIHTGNCSFSISLSFFIFSVHRLLSSTNASLISSGKVPVNSSSLIKNSAANNGQK